MSEAKIMVGITPLEFKALMGLFICADPTPLPEAENAAVQEFLNRAAVEHDFSGWIDAYHRLEVPNA